MPIPGSTSRVRRMKSMSERLAFPMYAVNDEDTQALWRAVRQLLAARQSA